MSMNPPASPPAVRRTGPEGEADGGLARQIYGGQACKANPAAGLPFVDSSAVLKDMKKSAKRVTVNPEP